MTQLTPTPNDCPLPRRRADFATLNEAIDYAARSAKGLNFYDARGNLERPYPYSELREDALRMAWRLVAAGVVKDDRVALIAETSPEFAALFCGCVLAGAWPVPLPLPTTFGGRENYIEQLGVQLSSADPKLLLYPAEIAEMTGEAATRQGCQGTDWESFAAAEAREVDLPPADADDICYLQYSSGSTRFPTGVAVTHRALLHNLYGHAETMNIGHNDRGITWLPLYHDMGLVGCFLSMIANQISVDYLKTEHFARRPLAWLDLISRNPGNSMS
jgi:fatty-acyl-CoA synthase